MCCKYAKDKTPKKNAVMKASTKDLKKVAEKRFQNKKSSKIFCKHCQAMRPKDFTIQIPVYKSQIGDSMRLTIFSIYCMEKTYFNITHAQELQKRT